MEELFKPSGFPGLPNGWTRVSRNFKAASDSSNLFYNEFSGPVVSRAGVSGASNGGAKENWLLVVHGLGEHGGRYQHFAHYLQGAVSKIFCLDLRGHGRSQGLRGYVESFDEYVHDVESFIREIQKHAGTEVNLHLFCHSMGGLIGIRLIQNYSQLPLASVSLSAPLLRVKMPVPAVKHYLGIFLAEIWSTLQLPTGINGNHICRDPEVIKAYEQDSLNHTKMTPKLYVELERAMQSAFEFGKFVNYPVCFFIPLDDGLVSSERTLEFFEYFEAKETALVNLEGFYHEPFNDLDKEMPFEELKRWIQKHSELMSQNDKTLSN